MSVGVPDGVVDGVPVGVADGEAVGVPEGVAEGVCVGVADGEAVGVPEGVAEGVPVGVPDGVVVGVPEGVPAGVGVNSPLSRRSLVFRTAWCKTNGVQLSAFTDAAVDERATSCTLKMRVLFLVSSITWETKTQHKSMVIPQSAHDPRSFFPHLHPSGARSSISSAHPRGFFSANLLQQTAMRSFDSSREVGHCCDCTRLAHACIFFWRLRQHGRRMDMRDVPT